MTRYEPTPPGNDRAANAKTTRTMKRKQQTSEQRRATIKANLQRGDLSEAARILAREKRIPADRSTMLRFLETGRSPLAHHYLDALECAQVRRLDKTAHRQLQPA